MVQEKLIEGNLILHYSDEGKIIRQVETGKVYYDAVDTVPCKYTYEETEERLPEGVVNYLDSIK